MMVQIRFAKILGYAGALPFIIFLGGLFLSEKIYHQQSLSFIAFLNLQMLYATSILNFMAGTHWLAAWQDNDKVRLILAILPTLILLPFLLLCILFQSKLVFWVSAILFTALYLMDRKYIKDKDYLVFRLRITAIVVVLLIASYIVTL